METKKDMAIEKGKIKEFIRNNKESDAFQCKICGIVMPIGKCGDHRLKTSHAEFLPIYRTKIQNNKDIQELEEDRDKVKLFQI